MAATDVQVLSPEEPRLPKLMSPQKGPAAKHTVHWFRKGLRLHDNPSLREGLAGATTLRCVFIIDPWFASSSNVGINKWRFLLDCLEDLNSNLKKIKSRLFVVRGQPADVLPKLFRQWGTTVLSFEEDPEPYGRIRDYNITSKCREVGITVITSASHTLYKLDKIIDHNGGKAPLTYHQFQALVATMPPPMPAEEAVTSDCLNGTFTPIANDHDDKYGVPTLEELGFDTEGLKNSTWIGGETEALERLDRHLQRKAWVASLGKPKITPQSLLANGTGLSPYLRFGCLSSRLFYHQLTELYIRLRGTRPPISLHGQLLWREFFYCAATRNPNFDRMEGNPICVQIPWDKNSTALAKWANGQTGFPWIDAIMHQLREEGWVHHLARHAVACFLTRGDLWISWEEGMKVFDELMLDTDWSMNAGMWMWWSCSSFFQQFFHCYCPVGFGRKADPDGDYIRRYLPCLGRMPSRYIHEPWTAPESVQRQARCTVGKDYPQPMLDHTYASRLNLARIHQVYGRLSQYVPRSDSFLTTKIKSTPTSPSPRSPSTFAPRTSCQMDSRNTKVHTELPIKEIILIPAITNDSINYLKTKDLFGDNGKNNYDFNNLAITSKALDYANKFFNKPILSQQYNNKQKMVNYYTKNPNIHANLTESYLNTLNSDNEGIIEERDSCNKCNVNDADGPTRRLPTFHINGSDEVLEGHTRHQNYQPDS